MLGAAVFRRRQGYHIEALNLRIDVYCVEPICRRTARSRDFAAKKVAPVRDKKGSLPRVLKKAIQECPISSVILSVVAFDVVIQASRHQGADLSTHYRQL